MKVLLIHCAYQFKGGEDTVVAEEMKLLQKNGVEVELLQFTNDENTFVNILQLPFNFRSYKRTRQKIKEFEPDVVHVHNLHFAASPSVVYAITKNKTPFVCTLHNYRLLCPSALLFFKGRPFLSSLKSGFPWQAVAKGVYKNSRLLTFWMALSMQAHHWAKTWHRCNRFIVLTNYAKQIFLRSSIGLRDDQITVKPNFCSLPGLPASNPAAYFLFAGRLSEEKGIRLLLNIFSSFPHPLVIAGDGPLKEEVVAAASKYGNITYVGSLQKEALVPVLANASALLFPSIWFEGMPLTIIEAFACSTPVIATRLGAMDDMVTPYLNGLHFEAGDEKGLRDCINQWQELSKIDKERYRQNARATYEALYTPQKNAAQLLSIYEGVLQDKVSVAAVASVH
ncbi:MAG TPA: glycosyltransferase family 4 protein [Flavisolibacter sp.]|nr:glycosyltransferase family 4 protein [Flavisolibacter sp.]